MKNLFLTLAFAFALISGAAYAGAKLQVYPGAWVPVGPADLAVHPLKAESYTESWFFMVQGADGVWLFVHFGISNMQPLSDFDGVMETTVLDHGKVTFVKDKISKSDVRYERGVFGLALGGNTLKAAADGWVMHVEQAGLKLDLTLKPTVAGLRPGRSVYPDGEFYQLDLAAPRTVVSGTLVLKGKTIAINGPGYFDHSLQDFPAHKMADRLYSFRGYSADAGVNYLTFVTPPGLGAEMPALVLMKDNQIVARTTVVRMSGSQTISDDDNDYTYPAKWTFEGKDGDVPVTGSITLGKKLQSQNAAEDFNMFERTLIKTFVANPMLYRHGGSFSFQVGGKQPVALSGDGVAEVLILRE